MTAAATALTASATARPPGVGTPAVRPGGQCGPEPVEQERGRQRGDDVVVEARLDGLEKREDGGADEEHEHGVGPRRPARDDEREDQNRRRAGDRPVREEPDPGLARIPGQRRAADGPSGDRGGGIAERHHGPDRRDDRQVRVAEDEDEQQDDGRIRHDPRVVAADDALAVEPRPIRGIAQTLNASAAAAQAAAPGRSSQRRASAKRPMAAWTALRFHSAGVIGKPARSASRRSRGRSSGRSGLQVPVVPRDVALEAVALEARLADPVMLARDR